MDQQPCEQIIAYLLEMCDPPEDPLVHHQKSVDTSSDDADDIIDGEQLEVVEEVEIYNVDDDIMEEFVDVEEDDDFVDVEEDDGLVNVEEEDVLVNVEEEDALINVEEDDDLQEEIISIQDSDNDEMEEFVDVEQEETNEISEFVDVVKEEQIVDDEKLALPAMVKIELESDEEMAEHVNGFYGPAKEVKKEEELEETKQNVPVNEHKKKFKHAPRDMLYQCPAAECGEFFVAQRGIVRHVQSQHPGVKPFNCDMCTQSFTNFYNFVTHSKRFHAAQAQEYVACEICGKTYARAGDKNRHVRISHSKERHFECEVCHKRFGRRAHLIVHVRIHTGERPYICQHCGKSYVQVGSLNFHLNSHNEDKPKKPWGCVHCDMRFTRKTYLKSHVEKTHLTRSDNMEEIIGAKGEKIWNCAFCRMRFCREGYLMNHLVRKHTHPGGVVDVKPKKMWACAHCDGRFTRRRYLVNHLNKKHPDDHLKRVNGDDHLEPVDGDDNLEPVDNDDHLEPVDGDDNLEPVDDDDHLEPIVDIL